MDRLPESPDDETRIGEAFGFHGDSQRPSATRPSKPRRHGFAREGEIPVKVVNATTSGSGLATSPRARMIALETALAAERDSHARTKRALNDALATIQALETKHAHAELAHADAMASERRIREQAEAALRQLQAPATAEMDRAKPSETSAPSRTPKAKRSAGVTRQANRQDTTLRGQAEPEPVKWWLPSYRSDKRRR